MKKFISRAFKVIVSFLPFIIGVIGYVQSDMALPDAIYNGISLYKLKAPAPTPNAFLEIARWTAPLVTASGILLVVTSVWSNFQNYLRYQKGDSVAVYGPEADRKAMLQKLGDRGIESTDRLVRAQRYILLNNEAENLLFYAQNREQLKGRPVYLKCSSLPVQSVSDPDLRLFAPEETAARQYWKERCLFDRSLQKNHQLRVVFLGFGRLGEELLTFGLQENLFHPSQRIEYHIFGDGDRFRDIHPQLSSISDPVIFHSGTWHSMLPLLEEADRVIVLTQEDQLSLLESLLLATTRREIDVFTADAGIELLAGRERLLLYSWQKEAELPERIFSDSLYERAKRINLHYAILYSGAADTEEDREAEWRKLDTFTRYSNISAADCLEIQLLMLQSLGKTAEECLELFSELEHMRWCRYHYLNNWRYGDPENGKAKDPVRRIHKDLIPYEALSDSEKQKDRENIRVLLSLT